MLGSDKPSLEISSGKRAIVNSCFQLAASARKQRKSNMRITLFGRELFGFQGARSGVPIGLAMEDFSKSKFLPDFYSKIGGVFESFGEAVSNNHMLSAGGDSTGGSIVVSQPVRFAPHTGQKEPSLEKPAEKKTPKEVYDLKLLHDATFKLNTNPEYVDKQLADFRDKLALVSSEEYDMRNGVKEISSIVVRLENRKKYSTVADFFDQYPYTTTTKVQELLKAHDYLKIDQVAQFLADMPGEATKAMKEYNKHTNKLCGKQAVFYIVADKKDFQKTNQRRDPILLAQSPFGHIWQILGAWDKEMLFLEEL